MPKRTCTKRNRHLKRIGLIAGAVIAVSATVPETFFTYQGVIYKRVEMGIDSKNIPILQLPADNRAGVIFIAPDTRVEIIAA